MEGKKSVYVFWTVYDLKPEGGMDDSTSVPITVLPRFDLASHWAFENLRRSSAVLLVVSFGLGVKANSGCASSPPKNWPVTLLEKGLRDSWARWVSLNEK
ncbi:hypothetical protein AVEN_172213-1 [Araneus ventricosus]|uniref:Uncharacterized protein n=1 Tax=Araneus ventricosus TaxID=182803 RepID=A0A4Y2TM96_ARAVE|nr:hypothetical protein AVEN_172213-1 [Araneus ventricosus]